MKSKSSTLNISYVTLQVLHLYRYMGSVTYLLLHSIYCLSYNLNKIRLDASSPNKRTVNIRVSHKLTNIGRGNTAPIENAYRHCCFVAVHLTIQLAYKMNHLPCSVGCCRFPRADCPDGFVCNHYLLSSVRWEVYQALFYL